MQMGQLLKLIVAGLALAAFSSSSHYQLQSYGINSGGTNSSSSSNYSLQGRAGEIGGSTPGSTSYSAKNTSEQTQQASVPPAPSVDNGSGTYSNKLHIVVNNSANPSDATFAIAISSSSGCASPSYIQADGTSGSSQVWQSYSSWGGSSGTYATGLSSTTTYYFCVAASEGKFTNSAFGPSANATTASAASISFSVSPNSYAFGTLTPGSVSTSSTISFTFTTSAANGGTIYISGDSTGLQSPSNSNYTIQVSPPGTGDLDSSNEGYGLQSTGATSLTAQSPYSSGSNIVGSIYTTFQPLYTASAPVASGSATAVVKAKSQITDPSGTDYASTLTFVAAASY